jgi:hypothetical protein
MLHHWQVSLGPPPQLDRLPADPAKLLDGGHAFTLREFVEIHNRGCADQAGPLAVLADEFEDFEAAIVYLLAAGFRPASRLDIECRAPHTLGSRDADGNKRTVYWYRPPEGGSC